MPKRLLLGKQNGTYEEGGGNEHLDSDFATWPKLEYVQGFASFFVAGFVDLDPEIMKAAVDKYFDEKKAELYRAVGLPVTRKEVLALVEAIRVSGGPLKLFLHR